MRRRSQVGAVGLGCMPMSWAYTASQQSGEGSLRTVHAALDAGCTLLDTADMYGPFTNELLLGRVLKERRGDAFVSTKCGLLVGEQHIVANGRPALRAAGLRRVAAPPADRRHRPLPAAPRRPGGPRRGDLGRDGRAGGGGQGAGARAVCGRGPRGPAPGTGGCTTARCVHLGRAQQVFPVSCVQAELSVWATEALEELLPWCAARGIGFLAAMPLGNGFLTGTLDAGRGLRARMTCAPAIPASPPR